MFNGKCESDLVQIYVREQRCQLVKKNYQGINRIYVSDGLIQADK